jgi:hypothetical protein
MQYQIRIHGLCYAGSILLGLSVLSLSKKAVYKLAVRCFEVRISALDESLFLEAIDCAAGTQSFYSMMEGMGWVVTAWF